MKITKTNLIEIGICALFIALVLCIYLVKGVFLERNDDSVLILMANGSLGDFNIHSLAPLQFFRGLFQVLAALYENFGGIQWYSVLFLTLSIVFPLDVYKITKTFFPVAIAIILTILIVLWTHISLSFTSIAMLIGAAGVTRFYLTSSEKLWKDALSVVAKILLVGMIREESLLLIASTLAFGGLLYFVYHKGKAGLTKPAIVFLASVIVLTGARLSLDKPQKFSEFVGVSTKTLDYDLCSDLQNNVQGNLKAYSLSLKMWSFMPYYDFPKEDWKRVNTENCISTPTNPLEKFNKLIEKNTRSYAFIFLIFIVLLISMRYTFFNIIVLFSLLTVFAFNTIIIPFFTKYDNRLALYTLWLLVISASFFLYKISKHKRIVLACLFLFASVEAYRKVRQETPVYYYTKPEMDAKVQQYAKNGTVFLLGTHFQTLYFFSEKKIPTELPVYRLSGFGILVEDYAEHFKEQTGLPYQTASISKMVANNPSTTYYLATHEPVKEKWLQYHNSLSSQVLEATLIEEGIYRLELKK
jgi:hypothetical protein